MFKSVKMPGKQQGGSFDLEMGVTAIIQKIGVPAHIKGYQYMRDAIIMVIKDMDAINSVSYTHLDVYKRQDQNRALLIDENGNFTPRSQKILNSTPMGRFGETEELTGTLLWLLSNGATFVNGVVVPVDGGFSAYSGV